MRRLSKSQYLKPKIKLIKCLRNYLNVCPKYSVLDYESECTAGRPLCIPNMLIFRRNCKSKSRLYSNLGHLRCVTNDDVTKCHPSAIFLPQPGGFIH